MGSFIRFEMKKMSAEHLYLIIVGLLVSCFVGTFFYWSNKDISATLISSAQGAVHNDKTVLQTTDQATDNLLILAKVRDDVWSTAKIDGTSIQPQAQDFVNNLKQKNNLKLNQFAYDNLQLGAKDFFFEFTDIASATTPVMKENIYKYLVSHKINVFPATGERVKSWNILAYLTGIEDTENNLLATQLILVAFIIVLSSYLTLEMRKATNKLMNGLPLARTKQKFFKLITISCFIVLGLLIAGGIFWLGLGLNPNHGFGSSQYVYGYLLSGGKVALMTIARYLGTYFLFIIAWLFVLATGIQLLSRLISNLPILIGLGSAFIFAQNLGLSLPESPFTQFNLQTYLNFPAIIMNRGAYASYSIVGSLAVMGGWILVFVLLDIVIVKKRGRL